LLRKKFLEKKEIISSDEPKDFHEKNISIGKRESKDMFLILADRETEILKKECKI